MGLLPNVARDLAVSIPAAGLLVSSYALGVTIGAPILAIVTARMPRRQALVGLIGVFIAGNLLCAIAPGYGLLMAARVVTTFYQGAFFGIGSVVASSLVAPNRRAQTIALMFTGLTLANVLGVPLGTALGQAFGWRSTFWAVTGIGVLAAGALALCLPAPATRDAADQHRSRIPRDAQPAGADGARHQRAGLGEPVLGVYLHHADPRGRHAFQLHEVTLVLLLFGLGLTVGGTLGGKLADWRRMPSLIASLALIGLVQVVFAVTMHLPIPLLATIFLWGVLAFAIVPIAQILIVDRAIEAAQPGLDAEPGRLQPRQCHCAWLGGMAIGAGVPLTQLPWVGVAMAVGALALTLWSASLERRPFAGPSTLA